MSHATTTVALALAAAFLAGCDPKPGEPPKPKSGETVAAANIPAGIVNDPSLPPASQVVNEAPAPAEAAQDIAPARPTGEPRKEEGAYESLVRKLDNEPPR